MNIGKLDTKVIIEKSNEEKNGLGELILSWSTNCILWVSVAQKSSSENEESQQKIGFEVVKLTAHYYAGITQEMRIYMKKQYWDILNVDYSDRHKMTIECKKKDNQ